MFRPFFNFASLFLLFAASLSLVSAQTITYDIVFSSQRDGNAEIYAMRADGSGQTNLSNSPTTTDNHPNWSPDGTRIVYSRNDGLWTMNADGSNKTRLTTGTDYFPDWSPNAGKIAFSRYDGISATRDIYVVNTDGTNVTRLTDDDDVFTQNTYPSWSPDGAKVAFSSTLNTNSLSNIHVMNADGSGRVALTNGGNNTIPDWSPDGTKILFTSNRTGTVKVFVMNADGTNPTRLTFSSSIYDADASWSPDGRKIAFASERVGGSIYKMNADGSGEVRLTLPNTVNSYPRWSPRALPAARADFDGDGKSDISVFRPSSGYWHVLKSTGGTQAIQWGLTNDRIVPGDFDGDRKTDFAVYRFSDFFNGFYDCFFYIRTSSDNGFLAKQWGQTPGLSADTPTMPADFDGDGKTDFSVYEVQDYIPAPGRFRVLQSSGAATSNYWGYNIDLRVPADYDGDDKADIAVFRNNQFINEAQRGFWHILQSSDNTVRTVRFGMLNDKPVPADYDADGKADIAVYRPSDGTWYRLNSINNSFYAAQFGASEDKPVPADYDGDRKTDIAVFRPSTGIWYLQKSTEGFAAQPFGTSGDIPIPSAFAVESGF